MSTEIRYKDDPVTIVPAESNVQMGVTIQFGAVANWDDYLEDEYDDNNITEERRDELLADYDGYQMKWAFDDTALVHDTDGAIDAACISSDYGNGGFCCGIMWTGTNTKTPEIWA